MSLPTQREMILNTIAALDEARAKLSDARDWMQSDWQPVGAPLPQAAAEARTSTLRAVASAKNDIDAAKGALHDALGELVDTAR